MPNTNPVVITQQPTQVQALTRDQMSQQIAEQEWANLAGQVPENERIVITQSTQNKYTIERQQLPDPSQVVAKEPTNWSGIILVCGIAVSVMFMVSIYLQHGG